MLHVYVHACVFMHMGMNLINKCQKYIIMLKIYNNYV